MEKVNSWKKTFTAEQKRFASEHQGREEEVFGEMLEHLTQEGIPYLYPNGFRNLDNSMFKVTVLSGNNDYFPVNCVTVRNSL